MPIVALCQFWLKLTQLVFSRCWKCGKFTDRQTDGQTKLIRKNHLSFQLRYAKHATNKYVVTIFTTFIHFVFVSILVLRVVILLCVQHQLKRNAPYFKRKTVLVIDRNIRWKLVWKGKRTFILHHSKRMKGFLSAKNLNVFLLLKQNWKKNKAIVF